MGGGLRDQKVYTNLSADIPFSIFPPAHQKSLIYCTWYCTCTWYVTKVWLGAPGAILDLIVCNSPLRFFTIFLNFIMVLHWPQKIRWMFFISKSKNQKIKKSVFLCFFLYQILKFYKYWFKNLEDMQNKLYWLKDNGFWEFSMIQY